MDLYLKDPPVFGHISFIVEAVIKGEYAENGHNKWKRTFISNTGKVSMMENITSSKRVEEDVEAEDEDEVEVESVVRPSSRVDLERRT